MICTVHKNSKLPVLFALLQLAVILQQQCICYNIMVHLYYKQLVGKDSDSPVCLSRFFINGAPQNDKRQGYVQ